MNENTLVPQNQNSVQSIQTGETASTAVAAQAKAIIESRYIVAMRNPRDIDQVRERLIKDCKRPGFAEVARYRKPIGQGIEGPSIRFAEAAIRAFTNVDISTITVYDDHEKRIVRVTVCDLEANIPYSQDITLNKTVERKSTKPGDTVIKTRTNSQGQILYILEATDDEILNKANALISKAIRTLGLRIIPGDIVEECQDIIIATIRDKDAKDPDAARKQLFDAYGKLGVQVSDLKAYLGHEGAVLQPKEMTDLRGIYNALKDGETSWREVMDSLEEKRGPAKTENGKGVAGLKAAVEGKK